MPDAMLNKDFDDCVLPLARTPDGNWQEQIKARLLDYKQLRMTARGFKPGSYAHNSHALIKPADLERVLNTAVEYPQCEQCGKRFAPGKGWAAYCSGPCRQKAYRQRQKSVTQAE